MSAKLFNANLRNGMFAGMGALVIAGCATSQAPEQMPAQPAAGTSLLTEQPPQPPIVNYKHVTLTNLNMNNQGNQIMIKPGKTIQAVIQYNYNCPNCYQSLNNQIIIGLARRSAQACIYNGGPQGAGSAEFTLKAPAKPGKYEVRFRGLQAMDCGEALRAGWNADNSPSKQTTIGTIIVSRKAES
ncbi:hypothetical protein AQUSIP_09480 [Aquicella siphonis]|uniref:Lipoprotein n=1 Tax=Aquicella siphonis TaxID=254247 RepID=A0A5E4PGK8_9COXI|nr:hypothetical protein [Aquicella siphonis]VVC75658.1 hypothetical protein AQUSIP_09480 [Aquicella siphonis]